MYNETVLIYSVILKIYINIKHYTIKKQMKMIIKNFHLITKNVNIILITDQQNIINKFILIIHVEN